VILVISDLFDDLRVKAGIGDNPNSRRSFMQALIKTLGEVNPRWRTAYEPPSTEELDGSIEIENWEYAAIDMGLRYFLQQAGAWAMDTDSEALGKFDTQIRRAIGASISEDSDFRTRTSLPAS